MTSDHINKRMIARSFGKAANTYDSVAHFQRWVGDSLLSKTPNTNARQIMDLGCGTGYFLPLLSRKYPSSNLIGLDLSEQMVRFSQCHFSDRSISWIVGDGEFLPVQSGSIDLIFSNLSIQWCSDPQKLFREVNRVLSPQGIFMFSSLLEGSLAELKASWAEVDDSQHVNGFSELRDLEFAIEQSKMQPDFLDTEIKVLRYSSVNKITQELKKLGAHNMTPRRALHVTGRQKIERFKAAYRSFCLDNGDFPVSYHVIWGSVSKRDLCTKE